MIPYDGSDGSDKCIIHNPWVYFRFIVEVNTYRQNPNKCPMTCGSQRNMQWWRSTGNSAYSRRKQYPFQLLSTGKKLTANAVCNQLFTLLFMLRAGVGEMEHFHWNIVSLCLLGMNKQNLFWLCTNEWNPIQELYLKFCVCVCVCRCPLVKCMVAFLLIRLCSENVN